MLMPLFRPGANPIMNMTEAPAALYFTGHPGVFAMPPFVAALPPLYCVAIGLWRQNAPPTATGAVFLAVHFVHAPKNLRR